MKPATTRRALVTALLAASAVAGPLGGPRADAGHLCGARVTTIATPVATFYVQDRSDNPPVPGLLGREGTWIFMESNGIAGLQTGGAWPAPIAESNSDAACPTANPDTLII